MAGNAARSGKLNEWAKAAAAVDFGEAGTAMAPGQKLAAARSLFELVDRTTFQLLRSLADVLRATGLTRS